MLAAKSGSSQESSLWSVRSSARANLWLQLCSRRCAFRTYSMFLLSDAVEIDRMIEPLGRRQILNISRVAAEILILNATDEWTLIQDLDCR